MTGAARGRFRRALGTTPVAVLAVALLALLGSAAASLVLGVPEPAGPDEFSYCLAADTFARGRLANPPHPLWEHFESFHIIQQPAYASKYPPAQGLLLALGLVLGGHVVVGVWIGSALMGGSITWMLLAWLPRRWAILGGLLAVVRLGIVGDWAQSYWGGALAATGGALLYGALRRVTRRPSVGTALIMGAGLLLLANTRPWEGLLLSLPAAVVVLVWLVRRARAKHWGGAWRVALPTAAVLLAGGAAMGAYNHAVTGSVTRMPYMVHEEQYAVTPNFLWQPLRDPPPEHRHEDLRQGHRERFVEKYHDLRTPRGYVRTQAGRLAAWGWHFIGLVLAVPFLLGVLRARRKPWLLLAVVAVAAPLAGLAISTYYGSHYMAPATSLVMVLIAAGAQRLAAWPCWRRFARTWLAPLLLLGCAIEQVPAALEQYRSERSDSSWWVYRAEIEDDLRAAGGRHLVIVEQEPGAFHSSWVYNGAEIDEQDVVWAHDMGPEGNRDLLDHYAGRTVWRLLLRGDGQVGLMREPGAEARSVTPSGSR